MKKWRFDFRIWHWVHAFVILGLLGTVFLRKTLLSWKENAALLTQKLTEIDISVTEAQAKVLAKAIRAPLWEWHILLGYALVALLLWRIALFFTQSGSVNYKNFKAKNNHKKMVVLSYVGLYVALTFMAVSGLTIHFYENIGLSKALTHDIKELHELVYTVVLVFVPLHIVGVVLADIKEDNGLISNMIHGKGKVS